MSKGHCFQQVWGQLVRDTALQYGGCAAATFTGDEPLDHYGLFHSDNYSVWNFLELLCHSDFMWNQWNLPFNFDYFSSSVGNFSQFLVWKITQNANSKAPNLSKWQFFTFWKYVENHSGQKCIKFPNCMYIFGIGRSNRYIEIQVILILAISENWQFQKWLFRFGALYHGTSFYK